MFAFMWVHTKAWQRTTFTINGASRFYIPILDWSSLNLCPGKLIRIDWKIRDPLWVLGESCWCLPTGTFQTIIHSSFSFCKNGMMWTQNIRHFTKALESEKFDKKTKQSFLILFFQMKGKGVLSSRSNGVVTKCLASCCDGTTNRHYSKFKNRPIAGYFSCIFC